MRGEVRTLLLLAVCASVAAVAVASGTDPVIPPIPADAKAVGNSEDQSTCICKKQPCPPCNPKAEAQLAAQQTAAVAKALKQAAKRKAQDPCMSPQVVMVTLNNNHVDKAQEGCPSKGDKTSSTTTHQQSSTHIVNVGGQTTSSSGSASGDSAAAPAASASAAAGGAAPAAAAGGAPGAVAASASASIPDSVLPKDTPAPTPAPVPNPPPAPAPAPAPQKAKDDSVIPQKGDTAATTSSGAPATGTTTKYQECFPSDRVKQDADKGLATYGSMLALHPKGPELQTLVKNTGVCPPGVTACLKQSSKDTINAFASVLPKDVKLFLESAKSC